MKTEKTTFLIFLIFTLISIKSFSQNNDYLIIFEDTVNYEFGYKNTKGDIVIPAGKYMMCFTDTIKSFGIVHSVDKGLIAIDKNDNFLYQVFNYDNGPDIIADGLFRIIENNKIGYADAVTGKIVIQPQFDCAWEFENGKAKVSNECKTEMMDEYKMWSSENWYYIDKKGNKVESKKELKKVKSKKKR